MVMNASIFRRTACVKGNWCLQMPWNALPYAQPTVCLFPHALVGSSTQLVKSTAVCCSGQVSHLYISCHNFPTRVHPSSAAKLIHDVAMSCSQIRLKQQLPMYTRKKRAMLSTPGLSTCQWFATSCSLSYAQTQHLAAAIANAPHQRT